MPSLGMVTINALSAADSVIIPVQAQYLPAKGMTQLVQTISRVKKRINPNLKIDSMLLTLVDTVIASESYKTFVTDLQSDIKTVLYDKPTVATKEYFKGKYVKVDDVPTLIDDSTANKIYKYLIRNDYIDDDDKVTDV